MTLKGHASELSLADIVQASALSRRTCRVKVRGIDLTGDLYLYDGDVVHATYGGLSGLPAFYSMVTDDFVVYEMETGARTPERTIVADAGHLLAEAMIRKDQAGLQPSGSVPDPQPLESARQARAGARLARWAALFSVVVVFASLGVWAFSGGSRPARQDASPPATAALESTQLDGPTDVLPKLVFGPPPEAPQHDLGLRPTVTCRLLVDTEGRVVERHVYRSRPELGPFEATALAAVAEYRFTPASREGQPVAVWINYPVAFR
jgi:protein TonB